VTGIGHAAVAPAAGVPANGGAAGEAMGVTCAPDRRSGEATASAVAPAANETTRRRESDADRDGSGGIGSPVQTSCKLPAAPNQTAGGAITLVGSRA
jgi:hypothetical protein